MRIAYLVILAILASGPGGTPAAAQNSSGAALHHALKSQATVYLSPDSTKPYLRLGFHEPVYRLERDGSWCRIRTSDGARGYVKCSAISNVWIRVSKRDRAVHLYRGAELVKTIKADFGYNVFADKEQRGSLRERDHWRTPEGQFYVVNKNPRSKYYRALVLNYPTPEDAERGLKNGLITRSQHRAIVRAADRQQMPPMNTNLGGWIEIHGDGTGRSTNWTQGCVAVRNDAMDTLWRWVPVGTPVLIE